VLKCFGLAETESAAEIHDSQARVSREKLGGELERGFMRRREKGNLCAAIGDSFDRERLARSFAPATKLRV
jgi:hypothetical protein